jgi:hypothetical protein
MTDDPLAHLAADKRQVVVFLARKWAIPRAEALILFERQHDGRAVVEGDA